MQLRDKKGHSIIYKMMQSSNDTIKIDLQTNDKKTTGYQFILLPDGKGHTLLIWNINTVLGWYPWKRIQGLVMDKITGPDYTSALQELKKIVEKNPGDSL